jgi:hypothetical protein
MQVEPHLLVEIVKRPIRGYLIIVSTEVCLSALEKRTYIEVIVEDDYGSCPQ